MEKSTVYFTDFRCPVGTSQLDKLKKLCVAAGIKDIDMDGKFVAIKMHFGELGNMAFLRPNYAKVVADLCKEQGGMPFLTDCNTLYPGSRKNALEHLDCANLNGFNTITTGCQILIGDGLRGTDEVEVPVPNAEYCPAPKIGRAIMDADIFISIHNNSSATGNFTQTSGTQVMYSESDDSELSSKKLAKICLNAVSKSFDSYNRGLLEGDSIYIIRTSKVPVALIEVGFMTNYDELDKLKSPKYQKKAAQGIYNAIMEAFEEGY